MARKQTSSAPAAPPPVPRSPRAKPKDANGKFASHKHNEKDAFVVSCGVLQGLSKEKIAAIVGIDKKTLVKHYAYELENGSEVILAKTATSMAAMALNAPKLDVRYKAAAYVLSRKGKWRDDEQASAEVDAPEGGRKIKITLKLGDRVVNDGL